MRFTPDITNIKFGRLTATERFGVDKFGHVIWICYCTCGKKSNVLLDNLLRGYVKSCGCLRLEVLENRITHGFSRGSTKGIKTLTEHRSWSSMKGRCYNTNNKKYSDYGGRGIIVCERWINNFYNFIQDMGMKPSPKHSIDRFPNNDGNYEPSNCRWATPTEQSNNRRSNRWLEYDGKRMTITEWAAFFNVSFSAISEKLKKTSIDETLDFYYTKSGRYF